VSITILIHSSKTMRSPIAIMPTTVPLLMDKTRLLAAYLQTLTPAQLQEAMSISDPLAHKVQVTLMAWNTKPGQQSLALDSFVGDIYSGLRASTLSESDRDYAQQIVHILSGLYGILRPYDGVHPYRLEMGYKLPSQPFRNLYTYWGSDIAEVLPEDGLVVNLSAVEYTKTLMPYIDVIRVVSPRFLTVGSKTGVPSQVTVHTKIARGAFARWLITSRITSLNEMVQFNDLNYRYDAVLGSSLEPTFVCRQFGGIGLSIR
jgi:cytoplasmic iron level regulating protein YaaA (DUF328/UPF0246 family)